MWIFIRIPRKSPCLHLDAVPTIFEELSNCRSSPQVPPKPSLSKRRKIAKQTEECQQYKWLDGDDIESYEQFSKNICDVIASSFPAIKVHQGTDHISLYKLGQCDDSNNCLTIPLTIRVYQNMTIAIWLQSTKLSNKDLGWILSHTKGELKWWSQIDNILFRYSNDTPGIPNADITSR